MTDLIVQKYCTKNIIIAIVIYHTWYTCMCRTFESMQVEKIDIVHMNALLKVDAHYDSEQLGVPYKPDVT